MVNLKGIKKEKGSYKQQKRGADHILLPIFGTQFIDIVNLATRKHFYKKIESFHFTQHFSLLNLKFKAIHCGGIYFSQRKPATTAQVASVDLNCKVELLQRMNSPRQGFPLI